MILIPATTISAAIKMMTVLISIPSSKFRQLTNPLQILPMRMRQLVLEHSQQIRNDIQPLRQQRHSLIHLQVRPDGLVRRIQLRFRPEKLGCIEPEQGGAEPEGACLPATVRNASAGKFGFLRVGIEFTGLDTEQRGFLNSFVGRQPV